ncbi:DNA repair protein [Fusobacterium nucleatum subsp. nucleatum ATCC 25586]|uniref:DNA repair protein n=2 Tax=Fusobacterium nucleatum subsp. nucleatum (strain ATCC 25586 / DSM 15643 / BCRC 10681 / CIP 101130 / JCM 8532 / KCTC 2640 / LMG 13131 / VPI 4355) TaxID=190304 RepID=A0ABN5J2Y1_FUSNN|nr:DEAD/DEAH box helicase family protein [Fusobacterium nucleatum]AVQ14904.1 DNA repair protein [Fusobacterium nucleatum subsp. nucleatum ATCC 25586]WMS29758.1 DEAD/DEAH box helicase family protein [Fusobacterium nucleatum]
MSLKDLNIEVEYRSKHIDIATNFYIPLLKEANIYKRAVAYFSSSSLLEISIGICALAKKGGKIKLVTSPCLSKEDIEAIRKGYLKRSEVIKNALLSKLEEVTEEFEKDRLDLLANLIAMNILEIKIVLIEDGAGIFHEKVGIIEDDFGNKVAFSGSMNESETAFKKNYETIDVFCNWKIGDETKRFEKKFDAFENMWNGNDKGIEVIDFPELSEEIIKKYKRKEQADFSIDIREYSKNNSKEEIKENLGARVPKEYKLRDYQEEAIKNWTNNNYRGIFDMATGTGKTLTALGAIAKLSEKLQDKLGVVIVCPFQHLVEQWVEDIKKFNMKPIIGFSKSPQKNWKDRLKLAIRILNYDDLNNFFCFICTNATFSSKEVQKLLQKSKKPLLLVVDEAHNFGAISIRKLLAEKYNYRLALSATFERYMDEEGTSELYNFFEKKVIRYPIKKAIEEKMLTPYYYYPIVVYLTETELGSYNELSKKIKKESRVDNEGKVTLSELGKILILKRARIVAGAFNKIEILKKNLEKYKEEKNILVYCGATNVLSEEADFSNTDVSDVKQIDLVQQMMYQELGMKVAKFTANESIKERLKIKDSFVSKDGIQAIVAIKCLDEGVNIPGIKTAFILASTTNPKEYIQRRGRVLRKAAGKEYAEIYDFITLPRHLNEAKVLSKKKLEYDISLVTREVRRMKEFSNLSKNNISCKKLIMDIEEIYGNFDLNLE